MKFKMNILKQDFFIPKQIRGLASVKLFKGYKIYQEILFRTS